MYQPVGMVYLLGGPDPVTGIRPDVNGNSCWTNGNVDGFRLRIAWAEYEPSEGSYLWVSNPGPNDFNHGGNDLDAAINEAYTHGKFVGISIQAGSTAPHWIYDTSGVYKFQLDAADQTDTGDPFMPLIWDTIYQTKWHNFLTAYAAHIASLPGKSAVRYIVITGSAKGVDMRTWCQNFDASSTYTDATLTDTGAGWTKIHSNSALFLSQPGNSGVLGKTMASSNGVTAYLRGGSIVTGVAGGMPADPIEHEVYVNKSLFNPPGPGTYTNQHVDLQEWLPNLGEFYQMNQLCISPPGGYAGLVGTANPNGMTGNSGNFIPAAELIMSWFIALFPNTPIIYTSSAPYATTQGTTDNKKIRDDNAANFSPAQYGEMNASTQASCPPHSTKTLYNVNPGGAQAIYGSNNPAVYGSNVCRFKSPIALEDLLATFFDHGNKFFEIYAPDCDASDPATGDPYTVAVVNHYRNLAFYYNPQIEDRGKITFTGI